MHKLCVCVRSLWYLLTWSLFKARGRKSGVWGGWLVPAGRAGDQSLSCWVAAGRRGGRTVCSSQEETAVWLGSEEAARTCSWTALWVVFVLGSLARSYSLLLCCNVSQNGSSQEVTVRTVVTQPVLTANINFTDSSDLNWCSKNSNLLTVSESGWIAWCKAAWTLSVHSVCVTHSARSYSENGVKQPSSWLILSSIRAVWKNILVYIYICDDPLPFGLYFWCVSFLQAVGRERWAELLISMSSTWADWAVVI